MENSIQIFRNNQFGEVRVTEVNGQIMFAASEVAKCLGYENPAEAVIYHCKSGNIEKCYFAHSNGIGGVYVNFIPESEVYRLIIHSKLPEAEKFQDWVFEEVLPTIRKHGGYIAAKADETTEELMARALVVAQEALNRQRQRLQMIEGEKALLERENKALAPKAEYTDRVLQSVSTYTTTQMAKELGFRHAEQLHGILKEKGILFKQSGQWLLCAPYTGFGYTDDRTHPYISKETGMQYTNTITVWTEKGRRFLHEIFNKQNNTLWNK
jgi:prophage antirepressor-like protein